MILGTDQLLKLVKTQSLITNLAQRELENPEGAGFDLQLGKLYQIKGKTFLGISERETVQSVLVAEFDTKKEKQEVITIKPSEFYLTQTFEEVNLPTELLALVCLRSTLYRSGIILQGGQVNPGYRGTLFLGMYNAGNCNISIELGARFAHIMFYTVAGKTNTYRGQWQGGRVVTTGRETQV